MSINTRKNSNYIPSGPPFDLLYSERVGVDMGMPLPKRHLNVSINFIVIILIYLYLYRKISMHLLFFNYTYIKLLQVH